MIPFGDIAKRVMGFTARSLAKDERLGLHPQPVEILPGMPAAPEPCCLPGGAWDIDHHPRDGIAQVKIDGIRALALLNRIVTRQALPFDAALHCLPALVRLQARFPEPMVFDGEYQEMGGHAATLAAHKRGEGCGTFYLFDAVPYAEWAVNRFTQPLRARLDRIAGVFPGNEPFLSFLGPVSVPRASEVEALAGAAWTAGTEGLVVKAGGSLYTRGRSNDWLKVKKRQSLDGPVIDIVVPEKRGTNDGVALVRLDGRVHRVAAMTADIRALLHRDATGQPNGLTGRMVEVEFNEHTEAGKLRGAHITRLRPDKEITR